MRILHTSDWHIGRDFENESLENDQRAFVGWLIEQVREHEVDLVIVAGDIWDKSVPKAEAVAQLSDALDRFDEENLDVVLISGNHDNAVRLAFRGASKSTHGVRIFAQDEAYPDPYVWEKNGERVVIVPIPFLDPQRFLAPLPDADGNSRPRSHQNALEDALFVGRERLAVFGNLPAVVVAHAYVAGSEISTSERHNVGNADVVSANIFDGFDYVALGHLHRPQEVSDNPAMAYSGSPLPYSFSEESPKSIRLVDLNSDGFVSAKTVRIPVGRPVRVLTDSMANLLSLPDYDKYKNYWISAKLTDELTQEQPMERLRKRFPHIASLGYDSVRLSGIDGPAEDSVDIAERTAEEIIGAYIADMQRRPPNDGERELVRNVLRRLEEGERP